MGMFFQENWLTCKECGGRLFIERPLRAYVVDHDELISVPQSVQLVCSACGYIADTKKQNQIRTEQGGI